MRKRNLYDDLISKGCSVRKLNLYVVICVLVIIITGLLCATIDGEGRGKTEYVYDVECFGLTIEAGRNGINSGSVDMLERRINNDIVEPEGEMISSFMITRAGKEYIFFIVKYKRRR